MIIKNKPIDLNAVLDDAEPIGIIHCGANIGEELPIYLEHEVKNRCWIEADPDTFKLLKKEIPATDIALNVAVCDRDGDMSFLVMDNGASSSLLEPKLHLVKYPTIKPQGVIKVTGRKLDTLVDTGLIDINKYDFLYMDLQGAEYIALRGFEKHISKINYILSEINYEDLYDGCMMIVEFDKYLSYLGFTKQWATEHETVGWGDAYYKRL
jgi:FkbM family methyltransferase